MNRLHLLFALLLCAQFLPAQQLSLFTQYRENLGVLNPAAVSADYLTYESNVSIGASYRTQWTSFPSNPTTQTIHGIYLNADNNSFNMYAGGYLLNDVTGPTGLTGLYGRVGGILTGDPYYGGISIGISVGLVQFRLKTSELRFRDPDDVVAAGGDQMQLYPDVGAGIYAYKRLEGGGAFEDDVVYGGISVPQVMGLDLTFRNDQGEYSTQRVQHFYGIFGFYKFFDEYSFLEPSVWVKYAPNTPVNVDFNLRYQTAYNFWIGTGVSTAKNFHLEGGLLIGEAGYGNLLRLGYGFDYAFTDYGPFTGGTHEVNLTYTFGTN
ncbi:MAG: PorP/SprF family type IX secretion system membrane protein [Saprospirales bacterium]|nr:PorP/SprF family type IX secretion system membrane protein [Saprospirales bacterium]MBK8490968.1 PorP/SprF family type IX secretion system membrane protein [Saprospirales bacterium]